MGRHEPPELTIGQRSLYLEASRQARAERAAYRARLKRGEVTLADALSDRSELVLRMPVRQLLRSLPGVGPSRADALMAEVGIARSRRVRGLGPRQREELLGRLGA